MNRDNFAVNIILVISCCINKATRKIIYWCSVTLQLSIQALQVMWCMTVLKLLFQNHFQFTNLLNVYLKYFLYVFSAFSYFSFLFFKEVHYMSVTARWCSCCSLAVALCNKLLEIAVLKKVHLYGNIDDNLSSESSTAKINSVVFFFFTVTRLRNNIGLF